jgi:hypothetical protein
MLTRAKRNARKFTSRLVSDFQTLIRAGLKSVFFGVESANDAVLTHTMNKGVKADDIAHTMECLREASRLENTPVQIIASFIYPVPLPRQLIEQGVTNDVVLEDNLNFIAATRPDSFHAAPGLMYPGTDWYRHPDEYSISIEPDTFSEKWIRQELSYHGFVEKDDTFLYAFNGTPLQDLLQPAMEFARRGNQMGIPSDLWEEQFIFARADGIDAVADLHQLSQDFFLDLLVCFDEKTRYLYDKVTHRSMEVANRNTHIHKEEGRYEVRKVD